MSQSGNIVFYSTDTSLDPAKLILQSLQLVDCNLVLGVYRSQGEDREWDKFKLETDQATAEEAIGHEGDSDMIDVEQETSECVATKASPHDVLKHYRNGTSLRLLLGKSTLATELWQWLGDDVPESVRGDFIPTDPGLVIGGHDIFEYAEHDEGHLFGRAFFSFSIFGYGTPNDWKLYREQVFLVPEIVMLQRRLEEFAGPLQRCVCWSI